MHKPLFSAGRLLCWAAVAVTLPGCAMAAPEGKQRDFAPPPPVTPVSVAPVSVTIPPQVFRTTYLGREAIRLTDGRTEAVIVPSLGRLMRYGLVGRPNWLWNAAKVPNYGGWVNYGGDKTWPSPQGHWGDLGSTGNGWPPPAAWDGKGHWFEVNGEGTRNPTVRTISRVAPGSEARVIREYRYDASDLVVTQTAEKAKGAPVEFGLWSIAQIPFVQAVYVPLNPDSPYKNNWLFIGEKRPEMTLRNLSPSLLEIVPGIYVPNKGPKVGADSPVSEIVAVDNGWALKLETEQPEGEYPDKAPVQIYVSGNKTEPYVELELLWPLRKWGPGTDWKQTVRWSLTPIEGKNLDDPTLQRGVQALLRASPQGLE